MENHEIINNRTSPPAKSSFAQSDTAVGSKKKDNDMKFDLDTVLVEKRNEAYFKRSRQISYNSSKV